MLETDNTRPAILSLHSHIAMQISQSEQLLLVVADDPPSYPGNREDESTTLVIGNLCDSEGYLRTQEVINENVLEQKD